MDNLLKLSGDFIARQSPVRIIFAIIALQFVMHIPFFSSPPVSQHTWRQVISLATAKNFYEEDARLLYPRSDTRTDINDPGINYQEFPFIYWILGMSYSVTGFAHENSRVLAFILASLLLFVAYFVLRELRISRNVSLYSIFFLAFSPLYFYYSINLLPNIPALMFFLAGLWCYLRTLRYDHFRWSYDVFGILFLSLAMVTKATWLFYGLLLAGVGLYYLKQSKNPTKLFLKLGVWGACILALAGLQFYHQFSLHHANPPERQDVITMGPTLLLSWSHFLSVIKSGVGHWFVELTLGYGALIFFVVGVVKGYKRFKSNPGFIGLFWILWAGSAIAFSLFFFPLYDRHAYYQTHILLPVSLISAYGLSFVLASRRWKTLAVTLVLLTPVYAGIRIIPRWTDNKQIPDELLSQVEAFQNTISKDDLVLVIGDSTPNVYLYYLERKGRSQFSFSRDDEKLKALKEKGYRWVVHRSDVPTEIDLATVFTFSHKIGNFDLYQF